VGGDFAGGNRTALLAAQGNAATSVLDSRVSDDKEYHNAVGLFFLSCIACNRRGFHGFCACPLCLSILSVLHVMLHSFVGASITTTAHACSCCSCCDRLPVVEFAPTHCVAAYLGNRSIGFKGALLMKIEANRQHLNTATGLIQRRGTTHQMSQFCAAFLLSSEVSME
jgi:hypothetical protein